jgi:hypothetical protein
MLVIVYIPVRKITGPVTTAAGGVVTNFMELSPS